MATKKKVLKKKVLKKKVLKKKVLKKKVTKKPAPKKKVTKRGPKPMGDVELVGYLVLATKKNEENMLLLLKSPHIAQARKFIDEYLGEGHGYKTEVLTKFKLPGKKTKLLYVYP